MRKGGRKGGGIERHRERNCLLGKHTDIQANAHKDRHTTIIYQVDSNTHTHRNKYCLPGRQIGNVIIGADPGSRSTSRSNSSGGVRKD